MDIACSERRANELIDIFTGRRTLQDIRAKNREGKRKQQRAKKSEGRPSDSGASVTKEELDELEARCPEAGKRLDNTEAKGVAIAIT
jgi:hypothetical protein